MPNNLSPKERSSVGKWNRKEFFSLRLENGTPRKTEEKDKRLKIRLLKKTSLPKIKSKSKKKNKKMRIEKKQIDKLHEVSSNRINIEKQRLKLKQVEKYDETISLDSKEKDKRHVDEENLLSDIEQEYIDDELEEVSSFWNSYTSIKRGIENSEEIENFEEEIDLQKYNKNAKVNMIMNFIENIDQRKDAKEFQESIEDEQEVVNETNKAGNQEINRMTNH